MKHKLIIFCAICAIITASDVFASGQPLDPSHSNYVVIGAFAIQGHADIWVANAKKMKFTAISAINRNRNLYYVYVMHTEDREAAFSEATKLRKDTPYWDTWVYTGPLGNETFAQGSDINPISGQTLANVEIKDAGALTKPVDSGVKQEGLIGKPESSVASPVLPPSVESTPAATQETAAPVADAEEGSKNFLFKIFLASDQQPMGGDVDVMDIDKGRKVASYKGNQNVVIRPVNKSGKISLVCDVFGYRKVKQDLNFNRPQETEGVVTEGNQTIVPFGLVRLQKGDISVMYNVYFFKDAAVMRPESRSEVTSLLTMMQENPKYKIKIHGHTNGGAPGKVISMGESKKFFALTDTKEGFGSAKKLSEERAKVIREYLKAEGIDEKRMEIKAWGGKRPVEDKMGAQAQSNVRVEIEILADK
jgi:outer membrane protein OmpA-like peptidoglycan-associated protein